MLYKDCYASFDGKYLKIGNKNVERVIEIYNNYPISFEVCDKINNKTYKSKEKVLLFSLGEFDFDNAKYSCDITVKEVEGFSTQGLLARLIISDAESEYKLEYVIKPNSTSIKYKIYFKGQMVKPSVENKWRLNISSQDEKINKLNVKTPQFNAVDVFPISDRHLEIDELKLFEDTDYNSELLTETTIDNFPSSATKCSLNIGVIKNKIDNLAVALIRDSYVLDREYDDLLVFPSHGLIGIRGNNFIADWFYSDYVYLGGTTITVGDSQTVLSNYKKDFLLEYNNAVPFIMSNTWGDGNRDLRISEEFILKEIEKASILGVDVVQIDDGWQTGTTMNSAFSNGKKTWGDFYNDNSDFWSVNKERFPNGLKTISNYAKKLGVKLGLWFALDKPNDYKNWEKDAEVILNLHKEFDIEYFKIDSLVILNPICENNIYSFVSKLKKESNNKIKFNMDVTDGRRFGYFIHPEISSLFVENRYIKGTSYYPHLTLRGLWSLSKIFPTQRFQFEVANNKIYDEKYNLDPLRPSIYSIDYIFASVMVANPLMWLELSSLDSESSEKLKDIIKVYKDVKLDFVNAHVTGVGEKPCGLSSTGFLVEGDKNSYLIALFEPLSKEQLRCNLNKKFNNYELIKTNDENLKIQFNGDSVIINSTKKPAYAVIKFM